MAKNKEPKQLKKLSGADLKARQANTGLQLEQLKQQKKQADTPEERQAIQDRIEAVSGRRTKIKSILDKRQAIKPPTYEELAAEIYASDAYQRLSDANKDLVNEQVDLLTAEQLRDLNPTKKQLQNWYRQAKDSVVNKDKTTGSFKNVKKQLDQTYEEQLRGEIADLEAGVAIQQAALSTDTTLTEDQKRMAMADLQTALEEARSQWETAAQRENEALQTQLSDIQKELDLTTSRADVDKALELKQLERQYNSQLYNLQSNMAQRGLAVSGIQAREQSNLQGSFEDQRTTTEILRDRQKEDARIQAEQQSRNLNTITSQRLQDLISKYTGIEREAIRSAESIVGTESARGLASNNSYAINEQVPSSYLYGNIMGSANATSSTKLTGQSNLHDYYANFEKQFGTAALRQKFGDGVVGATTGYAGYVPIGGLVGTQTNKYRQSLKENRENKQTNIENIVQERKNRNLIGKLI